MQELDNTKNELVLTSEGKEVAVVSVPVTVMNIPTIPSLNDLSEVVDVSAEYIPASKWQEGGSKNPTIFVGYVLGFSKMIKTDKSTGEVLSEFETVKLVGGFVVDSSSNIKASIFIAGQAALVSSLKDLYNSEPRALVCIRYRGVKQNQHGGNTLTFSIGVMQRKQPINN